MWYENPAWIALMVSIAALAFTIIDRRGTKNAERVKALEEHLDLKADASAVVRMADGLDKVEDRMTKLEAHTEHLPSKDATHRLELALSNLQGDMATLAERIRPISAMSLRLQETLIEGMGSRG